MKNQIAFIIFVFFGFSFLMYVFPLIFVEAAKLESGVTINAPSPAGTCPDNNGDGVNDNTGAPCDGTTGPVAGTCGLQIVSGAPINYGQLTPGEISTEQMVTIKSEGTSQARQIIVKGGDWISDAAGNPTISGPEVTRAARAANLDYNNKKPLSSNGLELGQISGGESIREFFQIKTWVNAPSGSYHQDVTIDLIC